MTVRPAEAAGLVLIRERQSTRASGGADVLLGRRHRRARFMPGVYVFPGGRIHAADRRPSGFEEALVSPDSGLDARSGEHLAVFARAALRETFEETGLLIAAPGSATPPPRRPGATGTVWAAYRQAGLAPAFGALRLVARAITPARRPLRFHTRFFLADGAAAAGRLGGDGELEDLRWVPVGRVGGLPMAEVSGLVLEEALLHRAATAGRAPALFAWDGTGARPRHRREHHRTQA